MECYFDGNQWREKEDGFVMVQDTQHQRHPSLLSFSHYVDTSAGSNNE